MTDFKCRNCDFVKEDHGYTRWECPECEVINIIGEEIDRSAKVDGLATAAVIAEKSDGDVGLFWNKEYSETGIIKDVLVRKADAKRRIEEAKGEGFLKGKKVGKREERKDVIEMIEERIEQIQKQKENSSDPEVFRLSMVENELKSLREEVEQ